MGLIGFKEGDTLLSLRQKLEGIRIFEFAFQFWDSRLGSLVQTKLEALIFGEDLEGKVVLFETKDSEESNLILVGPRVETEPPIIGTQPVERNVIYKEQNERIVDVSIWSSESSVTGNDRLEGKALFLSKRMSHATETAWREQVERLIIWQQKENKVDHEWRVRTWDEGECAVGVFECLECRCFLGRPYRGEEKATVQNVFINYRNKHIGCSMCLLRKQVRASSVKKEFGAQLARASLFREAPRECRLPVVLDKPRSSSVSNPSSTEDCEKEPGEVHSDLLLLCWGFWFTSTIEYGGNVYDVKPLLDDQKRGCTWLDYLTIPELRAQAQCRARTRRKEQIELFRLKRRVCTLMSRRCKVAQIAGDVAVILAEDETRVKPSEVNNPKFALDIRSFTDHLLQGRIPIDSELESVLSLYIWSARWEARRDTLIGFCGDKDNHVCKMGLEVEVGSGESGYSKIVESFEKKIQGSYARVVIVNPLHEKLPRLIVYASVTCNSFIVSWVRDHWKGLRQRWDKCCRQVVGPILGHASDGDARRRKLMLEDYLGSEGQRWTVGWDGWVLFGIVLDSGDVYALGDPIHNGKKMINPLDKSSYPIVLGDFHACLEHVQLVYKLYSHDHHGLNIDDVMRRNRQNWAGPQRICSRNVQDCLNLLQCQTDERRE
ncbi:hypothetical protein R1flu_008733 [Riccia fluitans]|uniref:Uncharacterized protein n=1 Tax=Riccia fluitans TaxID=41844 RepID=A0ABD1YCK5_9MARC